MRFTTSVISAFVATLAIAAPLKEKRQDLSSLFNGGNNNLNNFNSLFSNNQLSSNDIFEILSDFDLNGFNNQFNANFNNNNIEQLLVALEGNSFGVSNFNNINDISQFNLDSFSSLFNQNFNASWNSNEIAQLLLQLGLVNSNQFSNNNLFFSNSQFSNNQFSNSGLNNIEAEILSATIV